MSFAQFWLNLRVPSGLVQLAEEALLENSAGRCRRCLDVGCFSCGSLFRLLQVEVRRRYAETKVVTHLGLRLCRFLLPEGLCERTLDARLELEWVRPSQLGALECANDLVEIGPAGDGICLKIASDGRVKLFRCDRETWLYNISAR